MDHWGCLRESQVSHWSTFQKLAIPSIQGGIYPSFPRIHLRMGYRKAPDYLGPVASVAWE